VCRYSDETSTDSASAFKIDALVKSREYISN
jgi:hypothetical protein